jgi:hypothetical protein
VRFLFCLTLSFCFLDLAIAQPGFSGSFTDGQSITFELKQESGGVQGTMIMVGMDERFPMQITERSTGLAASVNIYGEVLSFQLSLAGDALMVTAGGELVRFERSTPSVESTQQGALPANSEFDSNAYDMAPQDQSVQNTIGPLPQASSVPEVAADPVTLGGETVSKYGGFAFNAPTGWKVKSVDAGFLLGHDSIPGAIIIVPSAENSIPGIRQSVADGLDLGGDIKAFANGPLRVVGGNQLMGDFTGQASEPITAYAHAILSPHGGSVNFVTVTSRQNFDVNHKARVVEMVNNIRFFKPVPYPVDQAWTDKLGDRKLTYMSSSSSSGYDGSSTSTSDRTSMGLCAAGHFTYYSKSSYSVSAGQGSGSQVGSGSSAFSQSRGQGDGTWRVPIVNGKSMLQLNFYDGRVHEYHIQVDSDRRFYLDGTRYFKTSGERGPDCP